METYTLTTENSRIILKSKFQAKDPLNGASASATGGENSARAFLTSGKREVTREYPSFATGLHNLPPTPASPFPPHGINNPFNAASKGISIVTLIFYCYLSFYSSW